MHLRDVRRWHWVVVSLLVGLAASYTWTLVEVKQRRTVGAPDFVAALLREPHEGYPFLKDLVIYPPVQTGARTTAYVANFLILSETARGSGEWIYRPASLVAESPFVIGREVPGVTAEPDETILAFLERIKADYPNVEYHYAWQREPWAVYTIWTGGSVLVMGLIWPSLISLAAGRGLGLKPYRPDEPAYDLDRFAGGDEPAKPAATGMTEQDAQQLAAAEEALRKGLGAAGSAAAPAASGEADATIKKLDGGPLEPLATPGQDEPKEYKGEYYPVAKPKAHPAERP